MTQAAKSTPFSNMQQLRLLVTAALSAALSHPEVLNIRRRRSEMPQDCLWRRRTRIAELAVDDIVNQGVARETAAVIVPKVFETICAGTDPSLTSQLSVV